MFAPELALKAHGKERYNSTFSLAVVLDGGGWSTPRSGRFTPGKKFHTHCTGDWVVSRGVLDGYGKSRRLKDSIRRPTARSESLYRLKHPDSQC
jgi:hypothetical protein